jgi:prepilin-type N-terminal cleavage/methylation domain-containing protein
LCAYKCVGDKGVLHMLRKKIDGFTIVELLIVIVIVGILASITVAAYSGVQGKSRDTQRNANIKSVSKALEAFYTLNGYYPPFSQPGIGMNVPAWRATSLTGVSDTMLTAPGASSVALVNSATPTTAQYGYRNGESCVQCPRFFLYWRSEVDSHVETVTSLYGQ